MGKHTCLSLVCASCAVQNHVNRLKSIRVPKLLVDTESECTWISAATPAKIDNLAVDAARKKLIAAGPLPAA
jgi:hypothetical protein